MKKDVSFRPSPLGLSHIARSKDLKYTPVLSMRIISPAQASAPPSRIAGITRPRINCAAITNRPAWEAPATSAAAKSVPDTAWLHWRIVCCASRAPAHSSRRDSNWRAAYCRRSSSGIMHLCCHLTPDHRSTQIIGLRCLDGGGLGSGGEFVHGAAAEDSARAAVGAGGRRAA